MVHRTKRNYVFRGDLTLGWPKIVLGGTFSLQGEVVWEHKGFFVEAELVLSLVRFSLQRNSPPATFLNRLNYGVVQSKLGDAGGVCKGLEDVVGSVRGFLRAQA